MAYTCICQDLKQSHFLKTQLRLTIMADNSSSRPCLKGQYSNHNFHAKVVGSLSSSAEGIFLVVVFNECDQEVSRGLKRPWLHPPYYADSENVTLITALIPFTVLSSPHEDTRTPMDEEMDCFKCRCPQQFLWHFLWSLWSSLSLVPVRSSRWERGIVYG